MRPGGKMSTGRKGSKSQEEEEEGKLLEEEEKEEEKEEKFNSPVRYSPLQLK